VRCARMGLRRAPRVGRETAPSHTHTRAHVVRTAVHDSPRRNAPPAQLTSLGPCRTFNAPRVRHAALSPAHRLRLPSSSMLRSTRGCVGSSRRCMNGRHRRSIVVRLCGPATAAVATARRRCTAAIATVVLRPAAVQILPERRKLVELEHAVAILVELAHKFHHHLGCEERRVTIRRSQEHSHQLVHR